MDVKLRLEKLECHFTWDLMYSSNELRELLVNLNDVDQQIITSPVYHYNLLGFIQKALGSDRESLEYLQKAENVIEAEGTEVQLQVNKANLAWVHFHLGKLEKSKRYLEELEDLQQTHPAPPGCSLHPEVSGEKGWTLVKFNNSKKRQAIDYFKMALQAEPERKEWIKGLAVTMSKTYIHYNCPPELKTEVLEQLKKAAEIDPDDLFIRALYLIRLSTVQSVDIERDMQGLLERTLETGHFGGLSFILNYFGNISCDKAIYEGQRIREKFPNEIIVLKCLANCYKWKVYKMKEESEERVIVARRSIELFEELVRHHPDSHRAKVALAAMYYYAHNTERADEIYQQLLSEKDLSPDSWQYIYYCYACYLYKSKRFGDSIRFHIKAAEIPDDSVDKEKSIEVLEKIVKKGRDPLCKDIQKFLKTIQKGF